MITKPASASGCADARTTSADSGADPRGSNSSTRRSRSSASSALHLLQHRVARHVEHAADDDPARLALGVGVDAVDDPCDPHPCHATGRCSKARWRS